MNLKSVVKFFSRQRKKRFKSVLGRELKYDYLIIIVLLFLLALFIFSVVNLIMVFRLRQEWQSLQKEIMVDSQGPVIKYYNEPQEKIISPDLPGVDIINASSVNYLNGADFQGQSTPSSSGEAPQEEASNVNDFTDLVEVADSNIENSQLSSLSQNSPSFIENRSNWKYDVFGDGFSNNYYVDMSNTNFHYDEQGTAFVFRPLYSKQGGELCPLEYCGLAGKDKIGLSSQLSEDKKCLLKNPQVCLYFDGKHLVGDKGVVKDFDKLFSTESPTAVSIYSLENAWLVGAVWNEGGRELGRAWYFDGQTLTNLDPEGRVPFITRPSYGGSKIYFGGDKNNYVVVYAGYDLAGYQIVNNRLWDITKFFNTRLASGGFIPQIFKTDRKGETVWYICSLSAGKPKLIKMWQNGSPVIRGLVSLSDEFFSQENESAICRLEAGRLVIAASKRDSSGNGYYRFSFVDNGFDQSSNYSLKSVNLSPIIGQNGVTKMIRLDNIDACSDSTCGSIIFDSNSRLTVSNDNKNWEEIVLGEDHIFSSRGNNIFWKIDSFANPLSNDYSPWFGAVNSVSYAWQLQR